MGWDNPPSKFGNEKKEKFDRMVKEKKEEAEKRLHELLGDDVSQIEAITLDTDIGKFKNVKAPEEILAKLRAANLL